MTLRNQTYLILKWCIAFVWLANGLGAKLLHLVPRHEQIVERILDIGAARILTILIGIGELFIAAWIVSGLKSKWCAWFQIMLVMVMNILEFWLASDLLLFAKFNLVIAILFCLLIYWSEYQLKPNVQQS